VLALATLVVLWVLGKGLTLYDRLPESVPTHFGPGGAPNAWGHKSVFSVFGLLMVAGVVLAAMALLRMRPRWYNFPGKERVPRLPPEQQAQVHAPLQESLAWLGASIAIGLSLFSQAIWAVALGERGRISPLPIVLCVVTSIAAVIIGTIVAVRRLRAFEEQV